MAVDPIRLRIEKALSSALGEISLTAGYSMDLPVESVFRGRTAFGDNDPLPMISILEVPIPPDEFPSPPDGVTFHGPWELMIQGFVEDDPENPTDPAHFFMADVRKRLALEKQKALKMEDSQGILGLGRFVTDLRIGAGVVRPPDEISAKAYFWLAITLIVVENMIDPYGD